MKNSLAIIALSILFLACVGDKPQVDAVSDLFSARWQLQNKRDTALFYKLLDDARWRMYALHAVEPIVWKYADYRVGPKVTFGQIDFRHTVAEFHKDSSGTNIKFYFFIYYDEVGDYMNRITWDNIDQIGLVSGIGYVFENENLDTFSVPKQILCWMGRNMFCRMDDLPKDQGKWKYDTLISKHRDRNRWERISLRMYYPENKELKQYLLANHEKLNPWFREEAIRRGLLGRNGSAN